MAKHEAPDVYSVVRCAHGYEITSINLARGDYGWPETRYCFSTFMEAVEFLAEQWGVESDLVKMLRGGK